MRRCDEILNKTKNRVNANKEGKEFWTIKKVRQKCTLSLLILLLTDLEKEVRKGG